MNFENWLYRETLKISELRDIYYKLIELNDHIDQLGFRDKIKDADTKLYKARCSMALSMLRIEEELKDACMKHVRRNKNKELQNDRE